MKKEDLKVGMSCEVITITADKPKYSPLYKKGNAGVVVTDFGDGEVSSCIGLTTDIGSTWFVSKGEFKKVGRLTITKLK